MSHTRGCSATFDATPILRANLEDMRPNQDKKILAALLQYYFSRNTNKRKCNFSERSKGGIHDYCVILLTLLIIIFFAAWSGDKVDIKQYWRCRMIYKLRLHGLKDSPDFKEKYKTKLLDLLEAAPSDSAASSYFRKLRRGYAGILKITSTQGRFVAKAVATDPVETARDLFKQINEQIKIWRSCRFEAKSENIYVTAD